MPTGPSLRRHSLSPLLLAFLLAAQLSAPAGAQHRPEQPRSYEEALARYRECISRIPFRYHTEGRETLARTRTAEALQILVAAYGDRKAAYPEYSRYTLASLFGRHFNADAFVPALDALRQRFDAPIDTWLWVQVLKVMADGGRATDVLTVAREDKSALHRAAAILALALARRADCESAMLANCTAFPRKEADRYAVLGALSAAVDANRARANDERFREALTAYVGLLSDDVDLPDPAKLQIARHLQQALKGPGLFVNPEPWLELMKAGDVTSARSGRTVTSQRFFGIESEGERICYVVDMSDSMCKEIAPELRQQGPVTGPAKKPKGVLPDEGDLPWHRIRTRFDLAREHLRISLLRLSKDKHFSVIWFGDGADTLESCKGMMKATKHNVQRVLAELDAIEVGKPDPVKAPDGTLRGRTNMHAGLRRAFGLARRGYVEEAAYVDPDALAEGCDTIFLLSDGAPSIDDFYVKDRDYGEGNVVVDQEYAAAAQRTPHLWYPGPYVQPEWLVDDVGRMNAFRRVRVHCIAIGEANVDLLRRLAEACYGQVFVIGSGK